MIYLLYLFALLSLHFFIRRYHEGALLFVNYQHRSRPQVDLFDYNDLLNKDFDDNIFPYLGAYAVRYNTIKDSPLPPNGCTVDVVNSLERHGARLMTPGALLSSQITLNKVKQAVANVNTRSLPSELRFLKHIAISSDTYSLLPYGALQAYYSGKSTAAVYSSLSKLPPFVRASGDEDTQDDRVILTSQFWLLGFRGGSFPRGTLRTHYDVRKAASNLPRPDVKLSEKAGFNNTLDVSTCINGNERPPSEGERGAQTAFAESTLVDSIGRRLASRLISSSKERPKLDGQDLLNLAQVCSFETLKGAIIHNGHLDLAQSPFCNVFNHTEWAMLGYAFDVGKWKGFGYGNPYHRAVATGFLRELLARFTNEQPSLAAPTSLNTTIDKDEHNFPLPNTQEGPVIYFDGSHDNNIAPIIASLGLFDGPDLQTGRNAHLESHQWSFGQIAPFQGKIVFEKLSCTMNDTLAERHFVRIRANSKTMRGWCQSNDSTASDSLCPLNDFAEMIAFAEGDMEWNKCYN